MAVQGEVPPYFGSDHDNPRTADAPVVRPDTASCSVRIVDHAFDDYAVHTSDYTPPTNCRGDWSKIVLTMHGSVAGRQYDRLGWLKIGGVPVFKTSTPEPSADGIEWTVEKDVTGVAALLRDPQQVQMYLGNTVDSTYTGIFDIDVDLTFYATSTTWPAAKGPETVQPLASATTANGATSGTLTLPTNTERLLAQVYATGSGGGCEEFWYSAAPTTSPDDYWCKTGKGPWRELEVLVDGRLAGIATPYPHIYTGGWSNPFLWYVLPAPRTFDLLPLTVDLTPFVGTLTDGRAHDVSVRVVGAEGSGWDVPTAFSSWQDEGSAKVTGAVRSIDETAPVVTNTVGTEGANFTADLHGSHALTTQGYVDTSHGRVSTSVSRTVGAQTHHVWSDGETSDGQVTTLTDTGYVRTEAGHGVPAFDRWNYTFSLDGQIEITDAGDLTTTITVGDTGSETRKQGAVRGPWRSWDHGYTGEATWNYTVPRDERRATGWSKQDFTDRSSVAPCWHRVIHTVNGVVTADATGC
ncbi:hypothetical protein JNB_20183 [Janibacter sp. HTCC2649]|nr:hypothetical protein JNB_20183 [Janibacter sp. HTCC2649]